MLYFICLSVFMHLYLAFLPTCLLSTCFMHTFLPVCVPVCLSLSVSLSVCLSVHLSTCLSSYMLNKLIVAILLFFSPRLNHQLHKEVKCHKSNRTFMIFDLRHWVYTHGLNNKSRVLLLYHHTKTICIFRTLSVFKYYQTGDVFRPPDIYISENSIFRRE